MVRINKFIAVLSGISRRRADDLIAAGKIKVDGRTPSAGYQVKDVDRVVSTDNNFGFDHKGSDQPQRMLLMLDKPVGYVCSRKGQGSQTIYKLLPAKYHHLKPVGRLDKDSSGLLLMTNDGNLADKLTHPRYQKEKTYRIKLDKPLVQKTKNQLLRGVELEDGLSKFTKLKQCSACEYEVTLTEGRNRQIRRTFIALDYEVIELTRVKFGPYSLGRIGDGEYHIL